MQRFAIALSALALLTAAGCGGGDDRVTQDGQGEQSGAGAGTEEGSGGSTPGGTVTIRMSGIAFQPSEATVKAGQTVRFVNEDEAPHDVDATSGSDFKSDLVQKGGTIDLPAEEPGTIEFVCSVHPNMKGALTVTD